MLEAYARGEPEAYLSNVTIAEHLRFLLDSLPDGPASALLEVGEEGRGERITLYRLKGEEEVGGKKVRDHWRSADDSMQEIFAESEHYEVREALILPTENCTCSYEDREGIAEERISDDPDCPQHGPTETRAEEGKPKQEPQFCGCGHLLTAHDSGIKCRECDCPGPHTPKRCPTCESDTAEHRWVHPNEFSDTLAYATDEGCEEPGYSHYDWHLCPDPFHTLPDRDEEGR